MKVKLQKDRLATLNKKIDKEIQQGTKPVKDLNHPFKQIIWKIKCTKIVKLKNVS